MYIPYTLQRILVQRFLCVGRHTTQSNFELERIVVNPEDILQHILLLLAFTTDALDSIHLNPMPVIRAQWITNVCATITSCLIECRNAVFVAKNIQIFINSTLNLLKWDQDTSLTSDFSLTNINEKITMNGWDWWFETTSGPLWCHINALRMKQTRLTKPCTVYPKKYAHGFVVLCFVVVMQSFIMNSHEVFIHIHQGCFAGTGAIVRLPQCQWSKPYGYGKISQCITTTKHSKAKTVCIFLGIYCMDVVIVRMWRTYDTF